MFTEEAIEKLSQAQAIDAANSSAQLALGQPDHAPVLALPEEFKVVDLEKHLPNRRRARGKMTTVVLADFAQYVNTHAEEGVTAFVSAADMKAVAVLNLGSPESPGHADNTAEFDPPETAALKAMHRVASAGPLSQTTIAEFMEDMADNLTAMTSEGSTIELHKAIGAVRNITIEQIRKAESAEQQISASRSAFESVAATSVMPLPSFLVFKCVPILGLQERKFTLRLGILTGETKPQLTLRVINAEQHDEEMADEMANLVRGALGDIPVHIGSYTART